MDSSITFGKYENRTREVDSEQHNTQRNDPSCCILGTEIETKTPTNCITNRESPSFSLNSQLFSAEAKSWMAGRTTKIRTQGILPLSSLPFPPSNARSHSNPLRRGRLDSHGRIKRTQKKADLGRPHYDGHDFLHLADAEASLALPHQIASQPASASHTRSPKGLVEENKWQKSYDENNKILLFESSG